MHSLSKVSASHKQVNTAGLDVSVEGGVMLDENMKNSKKSVSLLIELVYKGNMKAKRNSLVVYVDKSELETCATEITDSVHHHMIHICSYHFCMKK